MLGLGKQPDRVIKRSGSRRESSAQDAQQQSTDSLEGSISPQDIYDYARAIYYETRDPEHWQHMQRCADKLK